MRTPASAGVLARPDRVSGLRSMIMGPAKKPKTRGSDHRPKGERARRASDEPRRGAPGDRKGDRARGAAGSEGGHPARGSRRRPERAEDAGGFGPYARESLDFEGGRRRRDEPTRRGGTEPVVRKAAREAVARGKTPPPALRLVKGEPAEVGREPAPRPKRARRVTGVPRRLAAVAPGPTGPRPPRLKDSLEKASRALDRGHEQEALQILRPLRDRYPSDPDVRELLGVALYRLGRWLPARKELEAFVELSGSAVEHPVLMDCVRALGRHTLVDRLWEELRAASPAPEIMTEGRIVAAGSLADRGRITEAIKVLERGPVTPKRVATHHLRLWYALADLQERAGDLPTARALFRKISAQDPAFFDVAERLAALS